MDDFNLKKIEIVSGNGKDLDISPVTDYINIEKPKQKKEKKNIIVPAEKEQNTHD